MAKPKNSDIITEHFRFSEFASKAGGPVPVKYRTNVIRLARSAEKVRGIVGPIRVSDGWRTIGENAVLPGAAEDSNHLIALAGDFVPLGTYWTSPMMGGVFETLIRQGIIPEGELGVYKDHVHYAPTGQRRRWVRL